MFSSACKNPNKIPDTSEINPTDLKSLPPANHCSNSTGGSTASSVSDTSITEDDNVIIPNSKHHHGKKSKDDNVDIMQILFQARNKFDKVII